MELLAPAGNPQSFNAALQSGADAIYLGLPWFNARRPAMNFTPETLKKALLDAKEKDVKVYITLNTDLKSSEIEEAAKVLHLLTELDVDAVIIKDFGLYYLARECYPNLELHLSTQFGIANSYAAEQAKTMGATRIIPARELSFKELNHIQESGRDIPEIEVFVQGSMCFAFSGKCYLSSWVGGKSANRGVCQAPCRLKYSHDGNNNPYFSMKDLNLVSRLKDLKDTNVSSLKIEGRLKSPGWVSNISSIYRDALDGKVENEKSKEALLKHSGREMGEGFISGLTKLTSEHSVRFGKHLGSVVDLIERDGESYAVLNFEFKSIDTSLRFVSKDDEFLTIVHPADAELINFEDGKAIIKNIGKIKKDASVYEVIPARNSKSGIGKMRYDIELEIEGSEIVITVHTDSDKYIKRQPFKRIVKAKRGVYPDAIYDKLENKVVDGWRFNKLYCDEILLSKTQVNDIVKDVSYILAVTIKESNPLNQIELSNTVKDFIGKLPEGNELQAKESIRIKYGFDYNISNKNIIVDEIEFDELELNKLIELNRSKNIVISLFPVNFEDDMEELKRILTYLESRSSFSYEINDIGHYNLLKNYLNIDTDKMYGGQGMACYNHLSIKFLYEQFNLKSVSIPMEMDSRGVVKIVEENNNFSKLRFTALSTVPVMYSRAQSDDFYEGAEFEDKIGTVMNVHKYRGMNIFYVNEYFSSEGCRDLDSLTFSETITEQECVKNSSVVRKKYNLERRLY